VSAPVSVVIPTIGRAALLRDCLRSIAAGTVAPAEVVLVDQSGGEAVATLAAEFDLPIERVVSDARNLPLALNLGVRAAQSRLVAVTNDDCTVAPDWLEVAGATVATREDLLVTGRVLPGAGCDGLVPSCKTSERPEEHRGHAEVSLLFAGNMIVHRSQVLALGGFDEAFPRAADDGDFCFRWLRSGRALRYEPAMTVWHADWRSSEEVAALHVRYAFEQGRMYAKHLWMRDRAILPFVIRDAREAVNVTRARLRGRPVAVADWRSGLARGYPAGLLVGLVQAARRRRRDGAPR
jgi:GT2 family glycosyltransferase